MLHNGTVTAPVFKTFRPAAPDGGCNESGLCGGRWLSRSQVRLSVAGHRESRRHAPVVFPAAVLAPTQPKRAGLGACQAACQ